jgi:hypothetical protein
VVRTVCACWEGMRRSPTWGSKIGPEDVPVGMGVNRPDDLGFKLGDLADKDPQ